MLRKIILLAYIFAVTGISLLPATSLPIPRSGLFPHADKVAHFIMYAFFTYLLFYTWPGKFATIKKQFLPLLYVFAWGTIMEFLQGMGDYGRNFSYLDIIANTLGFFPGWLAWRWSIKNRKLPLSDNARLKEQE